MILMHNSPELSQPWFERLEQGVRNGEVPFSLTHGQDLWTYLDTYPEFDKLLGTSGTNLRDGAQFVLKELRSVPKYPLRHRPGGMGTLLSSRLVERLVFVCIPHVVGAPGELLLQLPAGHAAKFKNQCKEGGHVVGAHAVVFSIYLCVDRANG